MIAATNVSEDQAAEQLAQAWSQDNNLQLQEDEQERQEAQQARIQVEEEQRQEAAEAEQRELEKKKPKMHDFDDRISVPDLILPRPASFRNQQTGEF
jgi:hypothetical protein